MMRSHRGSWLGSSILASAFMMTVAPAVQAQPGYGADPFWPYNNQYTPYVTPTGPAEPAAGGQGPDVYARDGLRGANQFQQYMDDLQGGGPGRNVSDRSNIGMPYFRSAVDPSYSAGRSGLRQYQANVRSNERFEDSQRQVSDIYFRYYSERNPARRSEFLRQYRVARRGAALTVAGRGRSPSQALESSARMEAGIRRGTRSPSSAVDRPRDPDDHIGPAPEIPGVTTRRRGASSGAGGSRPSDVLNRSQAMDRALRAPAVPGRRVPGSPTRSPGRAADRPTTPPTPDTPDDRP